MMIILQKLQYLHLLMYSQLPSPFFPRYVYIILDCLFVIFGVLYMIGDSDHYNIIALRCAKPVPTWIMIIQLFPIRKFHRHILLIMIALLLGSVGDILLEFQSISAVFFDLGALSFLVGHILYVTSFLLIAEDISENKISMREVLNLKALYIVIWIILLSFSFWSVSFMVKYLETDSIMNYVLPIYGTCLVLLCMGGFFFFFTTFKVQQESPFKAGLFFMIGAFVFYVSDNILAHNAFNKNTTYKETFSVSINAYLIMITYYIAQFLMGKGGFMVCAYYQSKQAKIQDAESGILGQNDIITPPIKEIAKPTLQTVVIQVKH